MAVTFIPKRNGVDYQCLSTDMSGSAPVEKISWVGADVYVSDSTEWFRVIEGMYLVPLVNPPSSGSITVSISGSDLQIGAVELKDATTDNRAKIIQGSSITLNDMAIAVHDANTISASLVAGGSIVAIENKNITSSGFLSSVNIGDLTPWMITTSASQVITFAETINSLTIYASASPIYAKINSGSQCIYVEPSNNVILDGQLITDITIMGASDISLRYHAQYD